MDANRPSIVRNYAFTDCLDELLSAHKRWVLAADPRNEGQERATELHYADNVCAGSDALIAAIDAYVFSQVTEQIEENRDAASDERLRKALGLSE